MQTLRILLFAVVGVGAILALTSDKARSLRRDTESKARIWNRKLKRLSKQTANSLMADLKL